MTKRELVYSALNHEQNSRVPYMIMLTTKGVEAYGEQLTAVSTKLHQNVELRGV